MILLVFDASRELAPEEDIVYLDLLARYGHKTIILYNKADIIQQAYIAYENATTSVHISTKTKHNIDSVEKLIEEKIATLFSSIESPFLLNQRHYNAILVLEKKLLALLAMMDGQSIAYELISYHLNDALVNISELTGKSISEQGMDAVFREFCVGK